MRRMENLSAHNERNAYTCVILSPLAVSHFTFCIILCPLLQESLEERVQELEQALLAERIAAQRDRATITKLQRQINKVCCLFKINSSLSESEKLR